MPFTLNQVTVALGIGILALLAVAVFLRYKRQGLWSFLAVLLILLLAGIRLLVAPLSHVQENFSHALGDALFVAAILALTVDLYLKERVVKEIAKDTSKFLIGYRLPEEIQHRLKDLLQTQFVRRDCRIRLRFVKLENDAKHIKLETTWSEELQNITNQELTYQETIEFEPHDVGKFLEMRCDSEDPKANFRFLADELKPLPIKGELGRFEVRGKKIKIPPQRTTNGRKYFFTLRYETTFPIRYSEMSGFGKTVINVILEADCPEDLVVSADVADVFTPNRWEYKRVFMPGEYVSYRWEPRPHA